MKQRPPAPQQPDPEHAPEARRPGEASRRRTYRPPRLECHGRLAEVTCFGGSQVVDSGGGLGQAL